MASFAGLLECCAFCGRRPPEEKPWPRCARCSLRSYCSRDHQIASWQRGHSKACGSEIPTPASLRSAEPSALSAAMGEFGCGSVEVAAACCHRALAYTRSEQLELASAGFVPRLVAAMAAHRTHATLQRPCCQLLLS
eukprot:7380367-Prymnesium_polylepis.1